MEQNRSIIISNSGKPPFADRGQIILRPIEVFNLN